MEVFVGYENIISPLGRSAEENFEALQTNQSGISLIEGIGFNKEDLYLSKIKDLEANNKFQKLLEDCIKNLIANLDNSVVESADTLLIISTTKAGIDKNLETPITESMRLVQNSFNLVNEPLVISNACISGVLAMNTANNLIRARKYSNVIVVGADIISEFVLYGFQSLYAVSDQPCRPFDADRKGISLGEGAAGVVMSNDKSIFKEQDPIRFLAGTSANDANHISGPSRTGEGLVRTVERTIANAGIDRNNIDYISAHGTATNFNDEMESIALDRLGLTNVPVNSLKGYYGHTLGAAGLIEMAICLQSMRNNVLIKSMGFEKQGTSKEINMLAENMVKATDLVLKTASGFGGCNASAILQKQSS